MGEENKQAINGINQSTKAAGTAGTAAGPSTKTSTGTGTGTRPDTAGGSGEKVPQMVLVTDPATGESPKPKKKKKQQTVSAATTKETASNISMLIMACFSLAESKNPIWQVSPDEVDQIAQPAARIIGRLEAAEGLNKNADYFMLAAALAMVVLPRFIMMSQNKKTNTVEVINGNTQRTPDTVNKPANVQRAGNDADAIKRAVNSMALQ